MVEMSDMAYRTFPEVTPRLTPVEFVDDLMADGPGRPMAELALEHQIDTSKAESATDLLLKVLP
jgi:hypothetical protein